MSKGLTWLVLEEESWALEERRSSADEKAGRSPVSARLAGLMEPRFRDSVLVPSLSCGCAWVWGELVFAAKI